MISRRMDDKLEELKAYFSSKFSEQEDTLTKTFKIILLMISKKRSWYKYKTKFQNNLKK